MSDMLVVAGPSGVGKGTLLSKLLSEHKRLRLLTSHTTRHPRNGEQNGVDYHFVSPEEFQAMLKRNDFLEHAEFSGNWYGTSRLEVDKLKKSGRIGVLEIELCGVMQIQAQSPPAKYVFIYPPAIEDLRTRLTRRGTETEEVIQRRLRRAEEEIQTMDELHAECRIINDNLDIAYQELNSFVKKEVLMD